MTACGDVCDRRRVTLVTHTHVKDQTERKGGCVHEEAEEICASSLSYLYCSDNPTRSTMTVFLDSMNATRPSLFWSVTCVCVTADQGRVAFMVYAEAEEIRASCLICTVVTTPL